MSESKGKSSKVEVVEVERRSHNLYPDTGDDSLYTLLTKAEVDEASKQGAAKGKRAHPFNMKAVTDFKNNNVHHSTCIETKKSSTVGIGFEVPKVKKTDPNTGMITEEDSDQESKAAKVLNPLCEISFQDVIEDVAEDFWQTGNGYIEVVRDESGNILKLYHCPAHTVYVVVEPDSYNKHYEVVSGEGVTPLRFARFGDREDFLNRSGELDVEVDPDTVSELIHFRRSTSLSRWYGYPDWLAAVAVIELKQALNQQQFDFFLNRGVPEFMLFLLGAKLDPKDWEKVEKAMKANIGYGNSHKSLALNIVDENLQVQLEKLALEGKSDGNIFKEMSETLALEIVSAHRVPPLLAGILIPGKLGATNELPNALMAFQVLVIGPAQHLISTILDCTLGNPEANGSLGLAVGDFKFKKITDQIDTGTMDTVGRMRQTVPEARAEGRDLDAGVKKALDDLTPEEKNRAAGRLMALALDLVAEKSKAA